MGSLQSPEDAAYEHYQEIGGVESRAAWDRAHEDMNMATADRGVVLHGEAQEPPQWVIMGIEVPSGGVAVLASATLTRAQMRRRFEEVVKTMGPLGKVHLREEHNAVLFECGGFTLIHGATYRECMMTLPNVWQPPELGR